MIAECGPRSTSVEYHDDTVLPILCGECGSTIAADPDGRPDQSDLDTGYLDQLADLLAPEIERRLAARS